MSIFRDTRNAIERELDLRYAAARTNSTVAASVKLDHVLTKAIEENKRVSKLGAIADRIKAKKEAHDKIADEWAERLDALDRREPDAFAAGHSVLEAREADLADMEATMRSLSNLPNVGEKS